MRLATLLFSIIFLLFNWSAPTSIAQSGQDSPVAGQPNIVLINLDDADSDLLQPSMLQAFYPNMRDMATRGLRFTNLHATTPFCAPSRAALFRGQYAFNTGVKVNEPDTNIANGFSGGYSEFVARGYDQDELGVWLKNVGYRTMLVGKYHHHEFDFRVPPGWDDFRTTAGANYTGTFRFSNKNNPDGTFFQTGDDAYITKVDANDSVELIQQQAGSEQPFFLYIAPIAPHAATSNVPEDMVEPIYANFAANHTLPDSPDLHEADVSDKPRHLRFETPQSWRNYHKRSYISRVRAIKSVDDLVGRVYSAIEQIGAADNTYVFLTSDNGFQLGHHNLQNKTDPFNRCTNVPLLVTGPGITANQSADHLLAHIDICPTILELADAPTPDSVDAKSFSPLLFDPMNLPADQWQDGIMIENWAKKQNYGRRVVGSYVAFRKHHEVFVSWANRQFEYYNLNNDPFQLNNTYGSLPTPMKQQFKRDVRRFRTNRIEPITTLDHAFQRRTQNRNVRLRGYAEDDAGVFTTQVTMRSVTTDRYWNGESWQDEWFGHMIPVRNRNQPISVWNFRTQVEAETPDGFDYLVFTYRSLDSNGEFPFDVAYHVNEIDTKPPVASFVDFIQLPVFQRNVILEGIHSDDVESARPILTIRKAGTDQYFNGSQLVSERTELQSETTGENGWRLNVELPPGRYVAGVRGVDAAGNRQHPADVLRFRVESQSDVESSE